MRRAVALVFTLVALLTTPTSDGPRNLIDCHEKRPNNWGTHCGATRAAVAAYLGDRTELPTRYHRELWRL